MEHADHAGLIAISAALPPAVDLRASWWQVGDQGSTGSCVGWAVADSVLRPQFVQRALLGQDERLSVRFQWMAAKETDQFGERPTTFIEDDGTSLKAALDVARKFGCVKEDVLPFSSGKLFQGTASVFYALAAKLRIAAYFNLGRDLDAWRRWLAGNGPILTRLDVDDTWDRATDTKGVLAEYEQGTARGGHAVALVGYDANHFIVRNSWGTGWGDGGFAYATLDYARVAFTEAYGVIS